jgi:AbrB family looped-hinge helix DNA binding protein
MIKPAELLWCRAEVVAGSENSIDKDIVVRSSGGPMTIVTISPKFQVVIPREIRESLGLVAGQKVQALEYEGRVEFIPLRSARQLRGSMKGATAPFMREDDRL